MARELEFDGYWEGNTVYSCDCCHKTRKFRFDSEDEAFSKEHRKVLRSEGWVATKVNDQWHDFCGERCRNKYIREQTI